MSPNKIKEHLDSDSVDYLVFVFSDNREVKAEEVTLINDHDSFVHILSPQETVINLDKILYYEIHKHTQEKPFFKH